MSELAESTEESKEDDLSVDPISKYVIEINGNINYAERSGKCKKVWRCSLNYSDANPIP